MSDATTMQDRQLDLAKFEQLTPRDLRALHAIAAELHRARVRFGRFASAHEGYAVLLEEVRELEAAVFVKNRTREALCEEATQVGAMALRFLSDVAYVANPTSDDLLNTLGEADQTVERKYYPAGGVVTAEDRAASARLFAAGTKRAPR